MKRARPGSEPNEERRLRSAALKTAQSVLAARRRAERELVTAKEALEREAEQMRQERERLRAVFSQVAVGIGVCDMTYRFVDANRKFTEILGYSLEELRALTFMDLTHPEDLALTKSSVQKLLAGEIPHYTIEKRYVRKDGKHIWSRTTVTLRRTASGEVAEFLGVVEDITAQHDTHAELRAAREGVEEVRGHLAAVVESTDDAVLTKTLDGIVTTWNAGAERMFGYRGAEIIGRPATTLFPPERIPEEATILEKLRRGERVQHYETERMRKDGTRLDVSMTVSPLRDGTGAVIGASSIARDITDRKRSRELMQAEMLEVDRRKDEFLATLAHELRNPLAPIRQAALISKAPQATEAQKRWSHDVISRQVHHMALLLDDLLDISRITRGMLELRTEMTDLAAVIDAAVETARPSIDAKRHAFAVQMPPDPVYFAADPLRVAQVLSNLLTNAAKYTDPGGRIELAAAASADTVTFSVSDNGIGIPPDALGRLFGMFSQVKSVQDRSEGGLGIGLALAKGLVQLHGGAIEARSEGTGRGSEFIVRLPRHVLHTRRERPSGGARPAKAVTRRVLIADDNEDAAESLALLLRMEGHEVTVVHNGREALSAFANEQPEVALLDIGMPELNGYEVARQVREGSLGRAVTLIAVTGWGQDTDKARALAAGFNHHFTKPVEPEQLADLLRSEALRS